MNNNREFQKNGVKNSEQERFCPVQIKSQVKVVAAVEVAVADGFHDVVGADGDGAVKVANGTFVSINILCCKGAFAF